MLKVLGLVRSKFWSRKILGIDAGGGGDLAFNRDDEECLFDSGDGDGVVSRDDTDDVNKTLNYLVITEMVIQITEIRFSDLVYF